MRIRFYNNGINYLLRNKNIIRKVIESIASDNGKEIKRVVYIFCNKRQIVQLNRSFLKHDYPTDIITFSDSTDEIIDAEIYICLPVVFDNATRFGAPSYQEVIRVIFHGVLHCVGFDDHSSEEEAEMHRQENRYIALFGQLL